MLLETLFASYYPVLIRNSYNRLADVILDRICLLGLSWLHLSFAGSLNVFSSPDSCQQSDRYYHINHMNSCSDSHS
jgi:hypothetical protein